MWFSLKRQLSTETPSYLAPLQTAPASLFQFMPLLLLPGPILLSSIVSQKQPTEITRNESWKRPWETTSSFFLFLFFWSCGFSRKDIGMEDLNYMLGWVVDSLWVRKLCFPPFCSRRFTVNACSKTKLFFFWERKTHSQIQTTVQSQSWGGQKICQAELISNNQFTPV